MRENNTLPKNEIDAIIGYFRKYKGLMLGVIGVTWLLSIIYALWIHEPRYKATALMQIGKKNNALMITAKDLRQIILEENQPSTNNRKVLPNISNVKVINGKTGIIRIVVQGKEKEALPSYLDKEINEITVDYNLTIGDYAEVMKRRYLRAVENAKNTKQALADTNVYLKKNQTLLDNMTDASPEEINLLLFKIMRNDVLIERFRREAVVYNKQIRTYKTMLSPSKTIETHRIGDIVVFDKPITIAKSLIILIGLIAGILLAILLAFVQDMRKSMKKENE